jgi:hypothetical protein
MRSIVVAYGFEVGVLPSIPAFFFACVIIPPLRLPPIKIAFRGRSLITKLLWIRLNSRAIRYSDPHQLQGTAKAAPGETGIYAPGTDCGNAWEAHGKSLTTHTASSPAPNYSAAAFSTICTKDLLPDTVLRRCLVPAQPLATGCGSRLIPET